MQVGCTLIQEILPIFSRVVFQTDREKDTAFLVAPTNYKQALPNQSSSTKNQFSERKKFTKMSRYLLLADPGKARRQTRLRTEAGCFKWCWFKSYSDFAELVNFAYCLSFSGEGCAPAHPAQQACFFFIHLNRKSAETIQKIYCYCKLVTHGPYKHYFVSTCWASGDAQNIQQTCEITVK